ncbi:MAG TPA: ethanolamine utilization microcompartment protein EutL [Myxococcota bacterium]
MPIDDLSLLRPRLVACRRLDDVDDVLGRALVGARFDAVRHRCLGIIAVDQDDSAYIALDEATRHVDVDVVYGRSLYAGAAHGPGPLSGEVLGVVAGENADLVDEALWIIRTFLAEQVGFATIKGTSGPAFLAHVVGSCGRYLADVAGVAVGEPIAYLIAPPLEALIAVDAALKAAPVKLLQFLPAPSETNFSGAYLAGSHGDLEAARDAFVAAIADVVRQPLRGARRPERLRR